MYIRGKSLLSMFLITFLFISTNKVNVAAFPEATYFYVSPAEVRDVQPGGTFLININVSAAPSTYAWEVHLSWDPSVLELFYKSEGDFLKRGVYITNFVTYPVTPPWDQANLEGKIMVGCSLYGGVPISEWASGNGELFRLGFRVKANGTSVLNLFDTVLDDHFEAGAPAPTPYRNLDGFFFNEPFHDIAITGITASPTEVAADQPLIINVTVANEGNFRETFAVSVYADTVVFDPADPDVVLVGDEITVGTQTVTDLAAGANKTATFNWNTTGVIEGNYTMSAKSLLLDDDTRDNILIDGTVIIKPPALVHEIAITNVVPSPTQVRVGENVTINVTVKNEGNFSETFNVTVYADLDTAVVGDEITIGTQKDIPLTNATSTTLTLKWNTTGVSEGTYTISAKVPPVVGEREADKADNTYIDGTVIVQGAQTTNIVMYVVAGIVIVIVAAVVIYMVRFRKSS